MRIQDQTINPIIQILSESVKTNLRDGKEKYLIPIGIKLNSYPDSNYENVRPDWSTEEMQSHFYGLHFLKYVYCNSKYNKNYVAANMLAVRNKIVNANTSLVASMVKQIKYHTIAEDIYSEACVLLIEVVNRYNPDMGFAFSSFAYSFIYKKIRQKAIESKKNILNFYENDFDTKFVGYNIEESLYKNYLRDLFKQNKNGKFKNFSLHKKEIKAISLMFLSENNYNYSSLGTKMGCTKQHAHNLIKTALNKIKTVLIQDPAFQELER